MTRRRRMSFMLAGAASVFEGMGSIIGALFDRRRSPRMQRILDDLSLSDRERLRRDWSKVVDMGHASSRRSRTPAGKDRK